MTLAGVVVAAAIVCVLVFVVFKDDGGGSTSTSDGANGSAGTTTTKTEAAATTTTEAATTTTEAVTTTTIGSTSTTVPAGGAGSPQEATARLLLAMQDKDADAVLALFDPVMLGEAMGGLDYEFIRDSFAELLFDYESISFSGVGMDVEMTGPDSATVTITEGQVTITDFDGVTTVEDATESDEPVEFGVVKRGELWYIDPETF